MGKPPVLPIGGDPGDRCLRVERVGARNIAVALSYLVVSCQRQLSHLISYIALHFGVLMF